MSNVNKVKKAPVVLELEGKERRLRFTLNTFAAMEDKYGSVQEALQMVEKNNIRAIIFIIWAGLMWEDKTLTEEQVGDMIEISELEQITEKLTLAMQGDMPAKEDIKVGEANGDSPNK